MTGTAAGAVSGTVGPAEVTGWRDRLAVLVPAGDDAGWIDQLRVLEELKSGCAAARARITAAFAASQRAAEVIDLRSIVPLDRAAIRESVARTGRLVVVDEDLLSFGLSGEVVASVVEYDPTALRAAPVRVAVPDVPIPYARELEYAVLPTPARITEAVRSVMRG